MSLPIVWNPEEQMWDVKNPQTGATLWRGAKYADAAQFADDYQAQQQSRAQVIAQTLASRG